MAQHDINDVLKVGLPSTAYVLDYETRRVLESIKTALRMLALVLTDKGEDSVLNIPPDTNIIAGNNIVVTWMGRNRFKISAEVPSLEDIGGFGSSGGVSLLIELGDVYISTSSLENNHVLTYNSSTLRWVNADPIMTMLSKARLGCTVSGNTLTLLSGKLKMFGAVDITVTQSSFSLGGTQYFYVHHVRGSSTATWASAGAEPGATSTTDIDVPFYKFTNTSLVQYFRLGGDIILDVPLA